MAKETAVKEREVTTDDLLRLERKVDEVLRSLSEVKVFFKRQVMRRNLSGEV